MPQLVEVPLEITFKTPKEDGDQLEFYDGADSLFGYAKSLRIVTHYLCTGDVKFQAPAAKAPYVAIRPSRRGSFIQDVIIMVGPQGLALGTATLTLSAPLVRRFIVHMFRRTGGVSDDPKSSELKDVIDAKGGELEALSEAIDGPMIGAHRTVQSRNIPSSLGHDGKAHFTMTEGTLSYLRTRIKVEEEEEIKGVVASYNLNSQYGRIFDPEEARTIPFQIDKENRIEDTSPLTWSLDQRNRGLGGEIGLTVKRFVTQLGTTKKYFLRDCRKIEQ